MGAVTYPTLEYVAMEARPYPAYLLEGCETGLVLFAAAYLGHNDAVWFAEAGMRTTCVDRDRIRLEEMKHLYPDDWSFLAADAWTTAQTLADDELTFDVVSVDTFTGDAERRSLDSLELWCSLARKAVTVTLTSQLFATYKVPKGWKQALFARGAGVYWLVLTRD